jgi:hypothetical protein
VKLNAVHSALVRRVAQSGKLVPSTGSDAVISVMRCSPLVLTLLMLLLTTHDMRERMSAGLKYPPFWQFQRSQRFVEPLKSDSHCPVTVASTALPVVVHCILSW